jgi:hypothetical protein
MNESTQFKAADFIPEYWDLNISTIEGLLFLGQITIREMIRSWRCRANSLSSSIKSIEERIEFFNGKTVADLLEMAVKEFENPEFPHIGVKESRSWLHDPEPLDAASVNRKSGATTFNVCGWCKYTGGGTCRYNYCITTSCGILSDAGLPDQDERRFNTPCFLADAPDNMLDQIRNGLKNRRDSLISQKRDVDRMIKELLKLEKRAEKKPALPDHRPHDWFNIDDLVICFVGKWEDCLLDTPFTTAKVIMGYRHHDGCVSVCYDKKVHSGEYLEGHGGGYGMARPEVMHEWEFEYLLEHPDFASLWSKLGTSRRLENHDPEAFLKAMAHEAITRNQTPNDQ